MCVCGVLCQPIHDVQIVIEKGGIVQRQVGCGDGLPPCEGAAVGLLLRCEYLKKGSHCLGVSRKEYDFIALVYVEVQVFEKHSAFQRAGKVLDLEDLVAGFTLWGEDDTGVTA